LIAAFLVIPAAAARLLSKSFSRMTIVSVVIGIFSAIAGLWASYFLDVPSGAAIILLQAFVFFISMMFSSLKFN
jgi:zinc transport system permease protein